MWFYEGTWGASDSKPEEEHIHITLIAGTPLLMGSYTTTNYDSAFLKIMTALSRRENSKQSLNKANDRLLRLIYVAMKGMMVDDIKNLMNDVIKEIKVIVKMWILLFLPVV